MKEKAIEDLKSARADTSSEETIETIDSLIKSYEKIDEFWEQSQATKK